MGRFRASRFFVSLVTAVTFIAAQIPLAAFAQNSAQAEVLFKEGQQLIADKKYAEACQRLAASFKLDPQPNTELLQGLCYSKLGKTASAYNAFLDASSMLPKGGDAQKYAADQAKSLEPTLLKVRIQIQPIPPGVAIRFDDETKTRDKDFVGIDTALDPGEHDVYVTAPGKHDFTKHFKLDSGNSPYTAIVNLVDKTQAELDAEKNNGNGNGNGGGNTIIEKPEVTWSTVKTLGFIGILAGGATLIGAGVTQILAFVFQGDATTLSRGTSCNPSDPNDPLITDSSCASAHSYHQQALSAQNVAIGLGITGAVIGVTGIILFLVGGNDTKMPEKHAKALRFMPWMGPQGVGLTAVGTF